MKHWTSWRRARAKCISAIAAAACFCSVAFSQSLTWIHRAGIYEAFIGYDDYEPIVLFRAILDNYRWTHAFWRPSCGVEYLQWDLPFTWASTISDTGEYITTGYYDEAGEFKWNTVTWRLEGTCQYSQTRYYKYWAYANCSNEPHALLPIDLSRRGRYLLTQLFYRGNNNEWWWCTDRVFRTDDPDNDGGPQDFIDVPFMGNAVDDDGTVVGNVEENWGLREVAHVYKNGRQYAINYVDYSSQAFDFTYLPQRRAVVGAVLDMQGNGTKLLIWGIDNLPYYTEEDAVSGPPVNGYFIANMAASEDGNVIVGWKKDQVRQDGFYPFLWRRDQETVVHIGDYFASLLAPGEVIASAHDVSRDGRYIVGIGFRPTGYGNAQSWVYILDLYGCNEHNGDIDNNRCVDDADLLAVLFAFGQSGENLGRVDVNCDRVVDDADLLIVLFNFGSGC